jgi:predicted lipoprotein with Yx(FWY)xxD motif
MSAGDTLATSDTDLGTVLVDAEGYTLYLFEQDTGTKSTCTGDCAATWPAATVTGEPTAGDGVDASLIGTSPRSDGSTQLTYAGHPLYRFAGDTAPGDLNGQEVGDVWYAVTADGQAASGSGTQARAGY